MIDSLCPPSAFHDQFALIRDIPREERCDVFDEPFTLKELKSLVRSFRPRSSPGLDQIDNRIISSLPDEYLEALLEIFESILSAGEIPSSWNHALVFLIPKAVKGKYR